jgi:predicted transcriptional regulator of viral defense system
MPGRVYLDLLDRALEQHGYVTPDDAREVGVEPGYLRVLARRGALEHPARGVFRFPMTVVPPGRMDEYAAAAMWPQETTGVLVTETALDLYDICDINPDKIHLAVPRAYRVRRDVPELYAIHRMDLPPEDVTRWEGVPITTVRRTIADCIAAGVRRDLVDQAIKTADRQAMLTRADAEALRKANRPA